MYYRPSTVPPRHAPMDYRARHAGPRPAIHRAPRRRSPGIAWGALIIALAAAGLVLRSVEPPVAPAAHLGNLDTAVVGTARLEPR